MKKAKQGAVPVPKKNLWKQIAEFVPYAENVILLWNSSGTFWN